MRKIVPVLLFMFFIYAGDASAAVLSVDRVGGVTWNVLSAEDSVGRDGEISITYLANGYNGSDGEVSLSKNGDEVHLAVTANGATRQAEVSGLTTDIVEVLETESPEKIRIMLSEEGDFRLYHKGVVAETVYAISVNTLDKTFSVETPTGTRTILVLPQEATNVLEKARIMTVYNDGGVSLVETEKGELVYVVEGKKNYGFGKYINLSAPVTSQVSAITGEVVDVDRPMWISVIGGLLG